MVSEVRDSATTIELTSNEVAAGNLDLSQRTEHTASQLQHTASSVEHLSSAVQKSADSASAASTIARSAAMAAERGGDVMGQVVQNMNDIATQSRRIGDIIGVIDSIAFQTNILALNAAVEAARAGEQGRGFAVVAGEVRELAQRCATAAKDIKGLIGSSVERVQSGSLLVQQAGENMEVIVASVKKITSTLQEITLATASQSEGIREVSEAMSDLEQLT